jgi:acetolactate synthase-1/3 small subunit
VVDSSTEGFAIEVTGDPEKLNAFIEVMSSYGEIDVTRSGSLAIALESKRLKLQPPVPTVGAGQARTDRASNGA